MINRGLIGKTYAPMRVTLSLADVLRYAAATDDANPRYHGTEVAIPPMSVVMATLPLGVASVVRDPELVPVGQARRFLHYEEDLVWHASLRVDVPWRVQSRLADVQAHRLGEIISVHTQVDTFSGEPLAASVTSLFLPAQGERPPGPRPPPKARRPAATPVWEATWQVGHDQCERYAAASGDTNPIHLDDAAAQGQGLPRRILHGLCTLAFAQRCVVQYVGGGDPRRLRRLRARFSRPVFLGDRLTCAGNRATQVDYTVRNQQKQLILAHGLAEIGDS